MEAVQFTLKSKQLEYVKIPIPKISYPNEVLVKVSYSGVCGTDIHIIQGEFPCTDKRPLILGHEFSGIVVDFGQDVKNLEKGDQVVVDPNCSCHCCKFCHTGRPNFCTIGGIWANLGVKRDGGWAEYCIASVEQVHKLPQTISLETGALAEPLSCLSHGWDLIAPVPIGNRILITGAGIIGTLWVSVLHNFGHRHVTVCEPNQQRLDKLKDLDTNYNLLNCDELEKFTKENDLKFDTVIDCSGNIKAIEMALSKINFGGKLCIFGVAHPEAKISVPTKLLCEREVTILSVNVNPFSFPKALGLIESMGKRYLSYEKLGVRLFSLSEYETAIKQLKDGNITKAIFNIS